MEDRSVFYASVQEVVPISGDKNQNKGGEDGQRRRKNGAKGERRHGLECSGFWENLLTSPAGKQEARY